MPDKRKSIGTLEFEGCNFFRQRFVIATLAGKPIRVKSIRVEDDEPGLKGENSILFFSIHNKIFGPKYVQP